MAFAEFKVITVVMTGILFCLRPPCSAPGIGSTTDSASWDLPEVLRCSRSAERRSAQIARQDGGKAEWCSGVLRQCARRIGGQGRADNREFRAIARGRVTLPECSRV